MLALTLSPRFCALNMTFLIAFTHSSRLGTESADKCMLFWVVRSLNSFSPTASQDVAYRRSTLPWGKYGS